MRYLNVTTTIQFPDDATSSQLEAGHTTFTFHFTQIHLASESSSASNPYYFSFQDVFYYSLFNPSIIQTAVHRSFTDYPLPLPRMRNLYAHRRL